MSASSHNDWERLLLAASRLQAILPGAVVVGGTAAAIHAHHRLSTDADHVLTDLRPRFDAVLAELESVAGSKTARVRKPVLILGSLDGIDTGIRQLIREKPLETTFIAVNGQSLVVPTQEEILRIKGILIVGRNYTRDYVDFAAVADLLGPDGVARALATFDDLYPQPNGASPLQQLQIQLGDPRPERQNANRRAEYLAWPKPWNDWEEVKAKCRGVAVGIFDSLFAPLEPPARPRK